MATDAQTAANNYLAGMQSTDAQRKYKQGVQGFQGNPMQLAATPQAMQAYSDGVQRSINSGKRAAKLNAVPKERWQANALTKGAPRLASGAQAAMDKVLAHHTKWAPIYAQASQAARALPKGGKGNAMARISAALDVMMNAAGTA